MLEIKRQVLKKSLLIIQIILMSLMFYFTFLTNTIDEILLSFYPMTFMIVVAIIQHKIDDLSRESMTIFRFVDN